MTVKFRIINVIEFISFILLTVSGSVWAHNKGANTILEVMAYGLLLASILYTFFFKENRTRKSVMPTFAIVSVLFVFGLLFQDLNLVILFQLIMTRMAILITALLSNNYFESFKDTKVISDAVLCGVIISFTLALANGYEILRINNEGIAGLGISMTGGMIYKNLFGADMVVVFIGNYLCERYLKKTSGQKVAIFFSVVFLILANSRGALAMLITFLLIMNIGIIRRVTKRQRRIVVVLFATFALVVFVALYREIALNSNNYMYRIRGFMNYINDEDTGFMRLLLGNAGEIYGTEIGYVNQFRTIYGWDGSIEFALLNILIKNGILGLMGFIVLFITIVTVYVKSDYWQYKIAGISIVMMLLVSASIETYIEDVNTPIGIYCYLTMGGLTGLLGRLKQIGTKKYRDVQ